MKAVIPILPPDIAAQRRLTGADRWDEMWDGVLHIQPLPNIFQQRLEGSLETYLRQIWAPACGWEAYHQINVASPGGWPNNYRIPDLVLLSPERFAIDRNEYFEGAPDVVVEFHIPDDEAYDKFDFYAKLAVPEIWVIHRGSLTPEIHVLRRKRYTKQRAVTGGWLRSPGTGIELASGKPGKLAVRLKGDEGSRRDLPE
jgi:Uma2 family endonuclease